MHSMLSDDGEESNTAKGINISTEFNEFKMEIIQSKKHKLGTHEINKISILCFDDKKFVLNDGIHTLAYFHKDLRK